MAQQINLCNPIFLTQKHYFSAQTMARSLGVFVLLGGALSGYWSWSLQSISEGYRKTVTANQREVERLKAAIQVNKANSAPADAALIQALQASRTELQQREQWIEELRRGLFREGLGHSARLQLVARTIPAQAWVTEIRATDRQLELAGYTLEPASLNGWMTRLADSPLLQGQQLSVVKVERVPDDVRTTGAGSSSTVVRPGGATVWSYRLVTSRVPPATAAGVRP
jgi:Tfp pilus assembly protein PilN